MAGITFDDFLRSGSGGGGFNEQTIRALFDRFFSSDPADRDFDKRTLERSATEYLGRLPDSEFKSAARNAIVQAPPEKREGLLNLLLSALGGSSILTSLASKLGLHSTEPRAMDADDVVQITDYARHEKPEAMQKAISDSPWFLKGLGTPVLQGILGLAAAKLMKEKGAGIKEPRIESTSERYAEPARARVEPSGTWARQGEKPAVWRWLAPLLLALAIILLLAFLTQQRIRMTSRLMPLTSALWVVEPDYSFYYAPGTLRSQAAAKALGDEGVSTTEHKYRDYQLYRPGTSAKMKDGVSTFDPAKVPEEKKVYPGGTGDKPAPPQKLQGATP